MSGADQEGKFDSMPASPGKIDGASRDLSTTIDQPAAYQSMDRATPQVQVEVDVALPEEGENQVHQVSQKPFCTHQERTE